jgi:Phage integrase family
VVRQRDNAGDDFAEVIDERIDEADLKYLRLAAVKAGVIKEGQKVRFGFHNFRHSLATALVKVKVDAKTVQGMLRHEDFGGRPCSSTRSPTWSRCAMRRASSWTSYWATGFTCSRRRSNEKSWIGSPNRGLDRGLEISAQSR